MIFDALRKFGRFLLCHRAIYTALSCAYGLGCLGVTDKLFVNLLVTGLYLVLALRA